MPTSWWAAMFVAVPTSGAHEGREQDIDLAPAAAAPAQLPDARKEHPHRLAWRSMCATDEGKKSGPKWCKRAIWENTLPAVKRIWKNVNNVTSGDFVAMWRQRVSHFYARYFEAAAN
jgi:hypothetical protein